MWEPPAHPPSRPDPPDPAGSAAGRLRVQGRSFHTSSCTNSYTPGPDFIGPIILLAFCAFSFGPDIQTLLFVSFHSD